MNDNRLALKVETQCSPGYGRSKTTLLVLAVALVFATPVLAQQGAVPENARLATPIYVQFNPPADASAYRTAPIKTQVPERPGKMRFAFSKNRAPSYDTGRNDVNAMPVSPTASHTLHASQLAAARRKQGKPKAQPATGQTHTPSYAPFAQSMRPLDQTRITPSVTNRQYATNVPLSINAQNAPCTSNTHSVRKAPQRSLFVENAKPGSYLDAIASGQYDAYVVVSDEEYAMMQQGIDAGIDPARIHAIVPQTGATRVAQGNLDAFGYPKPYQVSRMEFSLANLPGNPKAVPLPRPSSTAIWNQFLTGRRDTEIRSWRDGYIELARHGNEVKSRAREETTLPENAVSETMMAREDATRPVEMKRLEPKPVSGNDHVQLVSGTVPKAELPQAAPLRFAPPTLRIVDDAPATETTVQSVSATVQTEDSAPSGKMKVYRPRE